MAARATTAGPVTDGSSPKGVKAAPKTLGRRQEWFGIVATTAIMIFVKVAWMPSRYKGFRDRDPAVLPRPSRSMRHFRRIVFALIVGQRIRSGRHSITARSFAFLVPGFTGPWGRTSPK